MFATGLRFSLIWAIIGMALTDECLTPLSFENSHFERNDDVATYHCNSGFKFEGKNRNFTCIAGKWIGHKFTCQKTCGTPLEFKDADIIHTEEQSVTYKYLSGLNMTLKCLENGWVLDTVFCDDPNADNTTCTPRNEQNESNLCIDGLISGTNITCTPNNFGNCSEPMTIPDTVLQIDYDGKVMYSCKPGYIQVGNNFTSFCENGNWTETDISCVSGDSENCLEPMNIPDSTKQMEDKRKVTYTCKSDYIQIGNISTSFCENGTWTETSMNCVPEICGPPPYVDSSRVFVDGYIANFTCEPEFLLIGNVSVSICENNTWTDVNMICVSKAAIALEKRQRQKSEEFQKKIENTHSLICSFLSDEQSCRCNNETAVMVHVSSNQMIIKHNYMSLKATSEKECDYFCLKDEMCLSSEFTKYRNLCRLSKTTMYLVENVLVKKLADVIYKEKKCVSSSEEEVQEKHPAFNLTTVSLNSILCSVDRNEIYCGCIEGRISFEIQINKKIARHNMFSFSTSDPKECSNRCEEEQNCLSAEYKQYKKVCHLSQTAHYLAEDMFLDSPSTVYFEKMCTPFSSF